MIIIDSIYTLPQTEYDEIWNIARMNVPEKFTAWHPNILVKHVTDLAPSTSLFELHLKLKREGKWSHRTFDALYKPKFFKQIDTDMFAQDALQALINLHNNGKKIALVCFCHDVRTCHRSLISEILTRRGIPNKLS